MLRAALPGRIEDVPTPRTAVLLQRLQRRLLLAVCCTVLTVPIYFWLLIRGAKTYIGSEHCAGPQKVWRCRAEPGSTRARGALQGRLQGFILLQLAWPVCMPSFSLLLLGWCLGALALLHSAQVEHCLRAQTFLWEASSLQVAQAVLLFTAFASLLTIRSLVQRLSELCGTDPEVVEAVARPPAEAVPADEECVICLSCEEEEACPWRQLTCGHRFHQPCLLEWLRKARRCPVCRLDLHQAYRQTYSL
ncbi:unnamed protein product [Prorocentrum cordatum]|uniref:RING-type domain-containing protein n=1 Tax=Prorocentrum cordatum TaxID=2364126 RepID=A0ABN9STE7_9DINO|nr:unnamed protein product [Polarella glacialis]